MSHHRRHPNDSRRSPGRAARKGGSSFPATEATNPQDSLQSARPRRSPRPKQRSNSLTGTGAVPAPTLLSPSASTGRRLSNNGAPPPVEAPHRPGRSRRRHSNETPGMVPAETESGTNAAGTRVGGTDGPENGASEREMRSILSEAFRRPDEETELTVRAATSKKAEKHALKILSPQRNRNSQRRTTIDTDNHPLKHTEGIPVHSLQTIESISLLEAPRNLSDLQKSEERAAFLASGAGNESSGIHNSFHFPEVNWKDLDFADGTVAPEPNKALLPHETPEEFARETESIFRSKSLEFLVFDATETMTTEESPRQHQCHRAASSHKPRKGRVNMSKQKSLSHLPVMNEKPKKKHGSNATTVVIGSPQALTSTTRTTPALQTVDEYPIKEGGQREKPEPARETKLAFAATDTNVRSPRFRHHHHSRSPASSPHPSPDECAKRMAHLDMTSLEVEPLESPPTTPETNLSLRNRAIMRQKSQRKESGLGSEPAEIGLPSQRGTEKLSSCPNTKSDKILTDVVHPKVPANDNDAEKPRSRARRHSFCALAAEELVPDSFSSLSQKPVRTTNDSVINTKIPSNDHSSCPPTEEYNAEEQESPCTEEKKSVLSVKTFRRQLRRMSDGGFAGAYSGIRQAVRPILSPRKNARRVGGIVKGVGHGLGKVLQAGSLNQSHDDDTKVTLECSPKPDDIKEVARMVGITDEQIKLLQDHGLTIADLKLRHGLAN